MDHKTLWREATTAPPAITTLIFLIGTICAASFVTESTEPLVILISSLLLFPLELGVWRLYEHSQRTRGNPTPWGSLLLGLFLDTLIAFVLCAVLIVLPSLNPSSSSERLPDHLPAPQHSPAKSPASNGP